MQDSIREVFNRNIGLISQIDRSMVLFREQCYEEALSIVAEIAASITQTAEDVVRNREYFNLVSTESVMEMLQGIMGAKEHRDYVLLADYFEMQLSNFICSIQELIMRKEDYIAFDGQSYGASIVKMTEKLKKEYVKLEASLNYDGSEDSSQGMNEDARELERVNLIAELQEELNPEELLKEGYCVEFTSCGLMTLAAADDSGSKFYFHTNNRITSETYQLARKWGSEDSECYYVYGFGMGYHLSELLKLKPEAEIEVFEEDINILKLYCAFSGAQDLMEDGRLSIIYDPGLVKFKEILKNKPRGSVCVHYPSLRKAGYDSINQLCT